MMNYREYKCVLSPPAGPIQYYENLYKPQGDGLPVCSTKERQEAHISRMSLTKYYLPKFLNNKNENFYSINILMELQKELCLSYSWNYSGILPKLESRALCSHTVRNIVVNVLSCEHRKTYYFLVSY